MCSGWYGISGVLAVLPSAFQSVPVARAVPVLAGAACRIFDSYNSGALNQVPHHGPQTVEALDFEEEPRYAAHSGSPAELVGGPQALHGAFDGSQRPNVPAFLDPGGF